jgi:hypothetical protein
MDINRNNYEAFLLDLMEGKLSLSEQQKVRDFLMLNPDCSAHLPVSDPWVLEGDEVLFSGRENLKKEFPNPDSQITESSFDLFSIARMEGDLTESQKGDHQQMMVGDDERRLEWKQWQQTRLVGQSVIYRGKSSLKRKSGVKRGVIWLSVLSSAAAIALLFIFLRVDTPVNRTPVAEQSPDLPLRENNPPLATVPEESLAVADEPVLFSIKKNREKPVESSGKGKALVPKESQDTLIPIKKEKLEPRPLRLASNDPVQASSIHSVEYDQIEALDIPPIKASITNLTLAQLAEIDIPETVETFAEEKDISFWSVANAGIKGLNKITGADMSLLASRDERGGVSGFRFKSKRFSVARPIERSE